jgi:uncharacterized protein YbaA (DUF1428 family)
MTYVDGFIVAVPTANKDAYREHAEAALPLFKEFGVSRMVEGWGDDVPRGKLNDLYGAVQAKEDETVLFSWVEYPDKATRDSAGQKMMSDPRMEQMGKSMPFDGQRMIYSGFSVMYEDGPGGSSPGYVDGIVLPVPAGNKDQYADFCRRVDAIFLEHGALRVVEAWGDDLMEGKVTDFHKAAHRKDDETVVFSWIEWPSKEVRDAAWGKLMGDERLTSTSGRPFDGSRMMFGGFTPIVDA